MRASLYYLPTVGNRAEIERGMAGLRPELYQRMLAEISGQAKLADQLGYHSISSLDVTEARPGGIVRPRQPMEIVRGVR
jgi:hypothetical protein